MKIISPQPHALESCFVLRQSSLAKTPVLSPSEFLPVAPIIHTQCIYSFYQIRGQHLDYFKQLTLIIKTEPIVFTRWVCAEQQSSAAGFQREQEAE